MRLSVLALLLMASPCILAQTPPDAGRLLQDMEIPPQPIPPSIDLKLEERAPTDDAAPGGPQVELRTVRFNGMTRFDEAQLQQVIADAIGQSFDLAGLRNLAHRVTRFYREQGYPFARAYLPPQRMSEGELRIEILEGRYGKVTAVGEPELAAGAQAFLSSLQSGEVIEGKSLERAALILGDQPGVKLTPVVRPGEEVGTGDLEARVSRGPAFEARFSADNHGNRYSGRHRAIAAANWNSPFMLGDQLSASAMLTDESQWFGQLGYALPLGASGLRGQISYAHTYYELGKEFSNLDATGTAKVASVGLSYPLVRTRAHNLLLSVQYQHKDLVDEYGTVDVKNEKSSDSVPVSLQFDARDQLAGGGITYGALAWTVGDLSLDSRDLRNQDRLTAKTEGGFQKWNFDIARLQRLPQNFTLFGRFSGQLTGDNLDSSESFSLGGASGVRAFPQGEGAGDRGWLTQVELRYTMGEFAPYVFYDAGKVTINAKTWDDSDNHRSISGFGAGVRWTCGNIGVDASVAWVAHGGDPESDKHDTQPRFWIKAEYRL
ncbi:MAG TPA: ShlB/FhaC/HecB family hemolysin secretion/activation protein [Burkholderiales bacterium]|nr:ShlB/FhaC/HecB family hemolysin secretion/activation protein [Burkholderiales bacterium]